MEETEGGLLDLKCFAHKQHTLLFRAHGSKLVTDACLTARGLGESGEQWLSLPSAFVEEELCEHCDHLVRTLLRALEPWWIPKMSMHLLLRAILVTNWHLCLEICMTGISSNQSQFPLPYPHSLRRAKKRALLLCSSQPVPLLSARLMTWGWGGEVLVSSFLGREWWGKSSTGPPFFIRLYPALDQDLENFKIVSQFWNLAKLAIPYLYTCTD